MRLVRIKRDDGIERYDKIYFLFQDRKMNSLDREINKLSDDEFDEMIKYFKEKGFSEGNLQRAFFKYRK